MKNTLIIAFLLLGTTVFGQSFKKEVYDNGVLIKTFEMKDNSIVMTAFYPDGTIKERGTFLNGAPNGKWVTYNQRGQAVSIGYYKQGVKEGTWTIYPGMGDFTYELVYENGIQKKAYQYGPDLD